MKPNNPTNPSRILIVEDEELLRINQKLHLAEIGFAIIEAPTADEAKKLLCHGADVDLVISDINMPGTLNGEALAEWLALQRPTLPVILTSARGAQHPLRSHRHRFIAKPYALVDLERLLRELLR